MKLLWLALIGSLFLVIAVEWFIPAQEPPVPSYSKPGATRDNTVTLTQADRTVDFLPIEQFQSVKNRPLFFEGRRPPPEYVPDAPAAKPTRPVGKVRPPNATLSGVIKVGDSTYVILNGVGKKKGLSRAKVGEDVNGWKVESIHDDRVVVQSGKEKHEILLRSYKPVPLPRPKPAKKAADAKNNKDRIEARKKALAARRAAKKTEQ
jgi:hypothetical protein